MRGHSLLARSASLRGIAVSRGEQKEKRNRVFVGSPPRGHDEAEEDGRCAALAPSKHQLGTDSR